MLWDCLSAKAFSTHCILKIMRLIKQCASDQSIIRKNHVRTSSRQLIECLWPNFTTHHHDGI